MEFIADFHIHSRFSRATSRSIDFKKLKEAAEIKGVKILGTGDFTHPLWLKEIKTKLEPAEQGLFKLKNSASEVRFILTTEISCIYSKNQKIRKIHSLIFAPSIEIVEKINSSLAKIGNLKSDGRPILGLDAKELLKIVLNISEDCFFVPCHAWTPWFSIFGSKSGFDSVEECFEDYSKYIYALETGLSADPPMFWRISSLDRFALLSNSDAHSPEKIGREANIFNTEVSYQDIIKTIKEKNPRQFLSTIEFYPEEGKYHWDGHRLCNVVLPPKETNKLHGICPVCKKPLTIGVLNRVEKLADREQGFIPPSVIPFKSLVPLKEIIAEALGKGVGTMAVLAEYQKIIANFSNEFNILLNISFEDLKKVVDERIAQGIIFAREGRVVKIPGYDGVYGKIKVFSSLSQEAKKSRQQSIFK